MINKRKVFFKEYKKEQNELAGLLHPLFLAKKNEWNTQTVTKLIIFHIDNFDTRQKHSQYKHTRPYVLQNLLESTIALTASLSSDWNYPKCIKIIKEYFPDFKEIETADTPLVAGNTILAKEKNSKPLELTSTSYMLNYMQTLETDSVSRDKNRSLWNHFFTGIDEYALDFCIDTIETDKDFMYHALFDGRKNINYAYHRLGKLPSHKDLIEKIIEPYYFKIIYSFRKKYDNVGVNKELSSINDFDALMKSEDPYLDKTMVQNDFDKERNKKYWVSFSYNNSIEKCIQCNLPLVNKKDGAKFCDEFCKNLHHNQNQPS